MSYAYQCVTHVRTTLNRHTKGDRVNVYAFQLAETLRLLDHYEQMLVDAGHDLDTLRAGTAWQVEA